MLREKLKRYAYKHTHLLNIYQETFGKIKTKYFFDAKRRRLQKEGYSIIQQIDTLLNNMHAQYFVDCGTLLGLIRDGKLIGHDLDIDFGIYFDENFTIKNLDEAMSSIGMKKERQFCFRNEISEISYRKEIISIDFFRHYESAENSTIYGFRRSAEIDYPNNRCYSVVAAKRAHIRGIKRKEINGLSVNIPENAEEYLASAYRDDWRIPNPNWSYLDEPGLVHITDEYGIKK